MPNVKIHQNNNNLYVEEIDVGEEKPRQVCSGLVKHVSIEEMKDRLVVVVCNLKPAKFKGFISEAMVLVAFNENDSVVEPINPPIDSVVGVKLVVNNYTGEAGTLLDWKKIYNVLKLDLKTNNDKVACYKGLPIKNDKGNCTVKTLNNSYIG